MIISSKKYNFLISKINQIMVTDQQVLAIVTELQASNAILANDLTVVIADIKATAEAGAGVSDSTLASLQSIADTIKANVSSIDAVMNPPVETEAAPSTDAAATS